MTWLLILAQTTTTTDPSWWQRQPGRTVGDVLGFLVAIAAFAGAVKAVTYLLRTTKVGAKGWIGRMRERSRQRNTLVALADDEGWPNGSDSLMESHRTLYNKVTNLEDAVEAGRKRLASTNRKLDRVEETQKQILIHVTDTQKSVEAAIVEHHPEIEQE